METDKKQFYNEMKKRKRKITWKPYAQKLSSLL